MRVFNVPPTGGMALLSAIFMATPLAAVAAGSANAFNPVISVILQGSYNAYSHSPDAVPLPGFAPGEDAALPNEGFSLGESEINLSANIDPRFYGSLTTALEDNGGKTDVTVEEAFIQTLGLPYGASIKAGRLFPNFGYMNEIHSHADSFVDRPLPYRAFLGGENLHDDGVQLSFLLPTDLYAEVGGGAFRGASFPAAGSGNSGTGTTTLFGRLGGDLGVSQSWLAGVSWLRAEAVGRETGDVTFHGTTTLYALDGKYTWSPNGNLADRSLVLQAEYLWRNEDGAYNGLAYDKDTNGWYAQAVYKFRPQWKAGYRYSRLDAAAVPPGLATTVLDSGGHDPQSQSLLLEWDYSEFSSVRLQLTRDESGPAADNEAVLRYTITMGSHGAHQY